MESFFALLQKNVLDRKALEDREELRIAIITCRADLPPSSPTGA